MADCVCAPEYNEGMFTKTFLSNRALNPAFNQFYNFITPFVPDGFPFWIAGGAVAANLNRFAPGDWDIFSGWHRGSAWLADNILRAYPDAEYIEPEEGYYGAEFEVAGIRIGTVKIQIINTVPQAPSSEPKFMQAFDLTCCQFACKLRQGHLTHKAIWHRGAEFRMQEERIIWGNFMADKTPDRVAKYIERGFRFEPSDLQRLANITQPQQAQV